jgi:hypothetical protein
VVGPAVPLQPGHLLYRPDVDEYFYPPLHLHYEPLNWRLIPQNHLGHMRWALEAMFTPDMSEPMDPEMQEDFVRKFLQNAYRIMYFEDVQKAPLPWKEDKKWYKKRAAWKILRRKQAWFWFRYFPGWVFENMYDLLGIKRY